MKPRFVFLLSLAYAASFPARAEADAQCLRNLGCQGGLSFEEFSTLSAAERQQRLLTNPRWCKVGYRGQTGWVARRYLAEGSCAQIQRKE